MEKENPDGIDRRSFLKGMGAASASAALSGCGVAEKLLTGEYTDEFLQGHFREMSADEIERVRNRLADKYREKYGRDFVVGAEPPYPNVLFAYGLDISRCIG